MPCTVPSVGVNYSSENKELKELCDKAYHGLDVAREAILAGEAPNLSFMVPMVSFASSSKGSRMLSFYPEDGPYDGVKPDKQLVSTFNKLFEEAEEYFRGERDLELIEGRQRIHRYEDIKRLRKHFVDTDDVLMLATTLNIRYDKPLKPQLGYDPDAF